MRGEEPLATSASLGAKASTPLDFARLFVEFANPHLLLDTASFNQFAKAADSLLGRFLVS